MREGGKRYGGNSRREGVREGSKGHALLKGREGKG